MPRTGTAEAEKLLQQVSTQHNIDIPSVKDRNYRHPSVIKARSDFCVRGYTIGLKIAVLAQTLDRHHATVLYHVNPEMRAKKRMQRRSS